MIFVDTGAWFASVVPWDANHVAATQFFATNPEPLITTDYVVDETLTLLRVRNESPRAYSLGNLLFTQSVARLHFLSPAEILDAWRVFVQFADKEWSFTDCTSRVVIHQLGLTHALSFDKHFRQFGSVIVVP